MCCFQTVCCLTFQALWYMNQEIFLSWRRVAVGRLQALVLCIKLGHSAVCLYTHRSHTIPPMDRTRRNEGLSDRGQDASGVAKKEN